MFFRFSQLNKEAKDYKMKTKNIPSGVQYMMLRIYLSHPSLGPLYTKA